MPASPFSQPPKPKPFDMTDPFLEHGLWCFWLTAETHVLEFVTHLYCVLSPSAPRPSNPFYVRPSARMLVCINPRYDYEEAWLWIYELMQTESCPVELDTIWENALYEPEESCMSDDGSE